MTMNEILSGAFRPRDKHADKYSVGTVTVVGGSKRYAHAPVIAGLGARAAGAGLVQLVVPDWSRMAAAAMVPEATITELAIDQELPRADVTVVGMGLGAAAKEIVPWVLANRTGRLVLDADALTVLAENGGCHPAQDKEIVLTPHEGEAARLLGKTREEVHADRLGAAAAIAERYGATAVLKGAGTLVTDGKRVYVNDTGNPMMALGGMGDLLSGMIGARWAYLKGDAFTAAAAGVWLHGKAGDELAEENLETSIVNTAARAGAARTALDQEGATK